MKRVWLAVLIIVIAALSGCTSANSNKPKHFGFDVISTTNATQPLDAQTIFPLRVREKTYLISQGKGKGNNSIHTCNNTDNQTIQSLNRAHIGLRYIDNSFVRPNFKLFTRLLVDKW